MQTTPAPKQRLDGLDLARFFAFVGMVIVNFDVVMVAHTDTSGSSWLAEFLQGKAAATFVVLAGVGLGLSAARASSWWSNYKTILKRALFLFVLGMLNAIVFSADIIHYYAFYFVIAGLCLYLPSKLLWLAIIASILTFLGLLVTLDYETAWNWDTYEYADFWTPTGLIRNLFFNGWHPIFPWVAFMLFGIRLSRSNLPGLKTQIILVIAGILIVVFANYLSKTLVSNTLNDPDAAFLFGTSPVPPMPLYLLTGIGCAMSIIGGCLLAFRMQFLANMFSFITPVGRQTLTLYIAHIFIGMGILDAFDMLENQAGQIALTASLCFTIAAIIYAYLWKLKFRHGPLEMIMRKLTG